MQFRSMLGGSIALLLLSASAIAAQDRGSTEGVVRPAAGLPGVFGGASRDAGQGVRMAQAADPRVTELEEQIRQLNGTIEELNFQVLQMQEQMRKMQEDNEYRFQQLEQKKSDAGGKSDRNVAHAAAPSKTSEAPPSGRDAVASAIKNADNANNAGGGVSMAGGSTQGGTQADGRGAPPKDFGTITFDAKGNVVGDTRDPDAATQAPPPGADGTKVAALPSTDDPEELYRNSYEFILSGDYGTAEAGFRDHIERFPNDSRAADAHYWLGEALLGQKKYRDAAEVFLDANKTYPKAKKAPDMLLKLGVSLAALNQRDVACATYAEVAKRYPDASGQLKQRLKQEEALASC